MFMVWCLLFGVFGCFFFIIFYLLFFEWDIIQIFFIVQIFLGRVNPK